MGGGRSHSFGGSSFKSFRPSDPGSIFDHFAESEGLDGFDFAWSSSFAGGSPLGGGGGAGGNRGSHSHSHSHSGFQGSRFGSSREGNGRSKTPESTVLEKNIGFTLEE